MRTCERVGTVAWKCMYLFCHIIQYITDTIHQTHMPNNCYFNPFSLYKLFICLFNPTKTTLSFPIPSHFPSTIHPNPFFLPFLFKSYIYIIPTHDKTKNTFFIIQSFKCNHPLSFLPKYYSKRNMCILLASFVPLSLGPHVSRRWIHFISSHLKLYAFIDSLVLRILSIFFFFFFCVARIGGHWRLAFRAYTHKRPLNLLKLVS